VVRRLGARDLLEAGGVEDEQRGAFALDVEHEREEDAVVSASAPGRATNTGSLGEQPGRDQVVAAPSSVSTLTICSIQPLAPESTPQTLAVGALVAKPVVDPGQLQALLGERLAADCLAIEVEPEAGQLGPGSGLPARSRSR
jgi:hypothetical protein